MLFEHSTKYHSEDVRAVVPLLRPLGLPVSALVGERVLFPPEPEGMVLLLLPGLRLALHPGLHLGGLVPATLLHQPLKGQRGQNANLLQVYLVEVRC